MSRLGYVAAVLLVLPGCRVVQSLERGDVLGAIASGAEYGRDIAECESLRKSPVALEEEYAIGGAVAARWVNEGGGLMLEGKAEELTRYLNAVGRNLSAQSSRPLLTWNFGVLESPTPNGLSAPGGYVLVTRGLLLVVENEAQLAGVLAHEIAHVTAQHALGTYAQVRANQCQAMLGQRELSHLASNLSRALVGMSFHQEPELLVSFMEGTVDDLTAKGFAESQEFEADEEALRLLISAGYQPEEYIKLLGRLPEEGNAGYRNHPRNSERQARLRRWLAAQQPPPDQFPEVDPEHARLPVVPFQGQLDWLKEQG